MSRPYTGNGIWKDQWSWGASCGKEKKGEEFVEVVDTGVQEQDYIPKSRHAPRKSLKLPRSEAKGIENYTLGPESAKLERTHFTD